MMAGKVTASTHAAGQVQMKAGPPEPKPKKNSSNTPVMIEM